MNAVFGIGKKDSPILVVDDEPTALEFIEREIARAHLTNPIVPLNGGQEALDYFAGKGRFKDRTAFPLPALLIVDWRMSGVCGEDVIEKVRSQASFRNLPIIVLSASNEIEDMRDAYKAGATSYLVKPLSSYYLVRLFEGLLSS